MPKRFIAVVAALTLAVAACSSDDDTAADPPPEEPAATPADPGEPGDEPVAPAPGAEVVIAGFAFLSDVVEVPAGTSVTWVNEDAAPHTATSLEPAGAFDLSLAPGESGTVDFDEPGTYFYGCTIHQDMTGEVIVT